MSYANTFPSVAPWDTPGLPNRHPSERCRWHNGLCAYRDDDPNLCTLCHASALSGKCTCVTTGAMLTTDVLERALELGVTATAKELAARLSLTPLAASRLRERSRRTGRDDETDAA